MCDADVEELCHSDAFSFVKLESLGMDSLN